MDDGLLDVCLIDAMPTVDFLALLRRVSNGEHLEDPRVSYVQTSAVEISCERRIKINVDGQVLEADRCTYDLRPRAATFLGYRAG